MRLTAIELDGFRAFAKPQRIDLDADTVILVGANGNGKTSIFDGILWALSGRIPRLGDDEKNIVSVYSSSGEAHVALEARSADGMRLRIARSFDGYQQRLRLEIGSDVLREEEARFHLLRQFWPDALVTSDSTAAFTAAITRSVYLQQDLVRQFVDADSEQQRFAAVSELVGAGRVSELQLQLDRAKSAWSRVTNARAKEAEPARLRLRRLEAEMETLSRPAQEFAWEIDTTWPVWWTKAKELGVTVRYPADAASSDSPQALDAGVKQLLALRQSADRKRDQVQRLLAEIVSRGNVVLPDDAALRQGLEAALSHLETARQELARAQAISAERRRAQVAQQETHEELRALAQLALRHLRDRCPVCTQPHNETATRAHLQQLIGSTPADGPIDNDDVRAAATLVEQREKAKSTAELDLHRAEQTVGEQRTWLGERDRRLHDLGVAGASDSVQALRALDADLVALANTLKVHQERGEHLALGLAQMSERARRTELEREIANVRREIENLDRFGASREETGQLAGRVLDGFREAAADVVEARLERIEPLLQKIYARIDPHPAFRAITFHSWFRHGRGHLATRIDDPLTNVGTESPAVVLSSSQMNALAVSIFLAFNLGVETVPLHTAIIDDPLQSLDDVNLLGLIDLLRRIKERRQLLLSTHDPRFGRLLSRKLRPVSDAQRTLAIELLTWTREGPTLSPHEIIRDRSRLRIVA